MRKNSQSGNVLFLILIAVALFAALSFVIAQTSRSGSSDGATEKMRLQAAEMLNYITSMQTAINRLSFKCPVEEISFERAPFNGSDPYFVNPNSPPNFSCHIFHPNGGSAYYWEAKEYQNVKSIWPQYQYTKFSANFGMVGLGSNTQAELQIVMGMNNMALCKELNRTQIGLSPTAAPPSKGSSDYALDYKGVIETIPAYQIWNEGTMASPFPPSGTYSFCLENNARNGGQPMQLFITALVPQ